jgi:hypothetical protein
MPCHYSIEPIAKQLDDECERNFFIGDQVTHKFECDAGLRIMLILQMHFLAF